MGREQRNLRIEYRQGRIVLLGDPAAIREEAKRIIRRFRDSARPYRLCDEDRECVVLGPVA